MHKKFKKYPNRRLYDVENKCYVNTEAVKKAILSLNDVQVLDAKTDEDITTGTLLQILNQQDADNSGQKIITTQTLASLIRLYEHPFGTMLSTYIETTLSWINKQTELETWISGAHTQTNYMQDWQQVWSNLYKINPTVTNNEEQEISSTSKKIDTEDKQKTKLQSQKA